MRFAFKFFERSPHGVRILRHVSGKFLPISCFDRANESLDSVFELFVLGVDVWAESMLELFAQFIFVLDEVDDIWGKG